jgi:hypothetical protein
VDGEEQPCGDTIWIMNRLNELRVKAGHPQMRHTNVLRGVRDDAKEKLGPQIAALNFEPGVDANGQKRPLIRFSDAVLLNVAAAVGGAELNRLKKAS